MTNLPSFVRPTEAPGGSAIVIVGCGIIGLGAAAGLVHEEGIVDYTAVSDTLVDRIIELGGEVQTSMAVETIAATQQGWIVATPRGDVRASYLVNCAGLQCDHIARLAGEQLD